MLLPHAEILRALQHPDAPVRLTALDHLVHAKADDPAIMLSVIDAARGLDREPASRLVYRAAHLRQTPATVDWALRELGQPLDHDVLADNNYRYALATVLLRADTEALRPRERDIFACEQFPVELHDRIDHRLLAHRLPWRENWDAWIRLLGEAIDDIEVRYDWRLAHHMEALGRHAKEAGPLALQGLRRQGKGLEARVAEVFRGEFMDLAGAMRLEKAVPLLMPVLKERDEFLNEDAEEALGRIGLPAVRAIARLWWEEDVDFRLSAARVLELVPGDLAEERAVCFLDREADDDVYYALAEALLHMFSQEGLAVALDLLTDGAELTPGQLPWACQVFEVAAVMGVESPGMQSVRQEVEGLMTQMGNGSAETWPIASVYLDELDEQEPPAEDQESGSSLAAGGPMSLPFAGAMPSTDDLDEELGRDVEVAGGDFGELEDEGRRRPE